jgi:hypothetical protein
MSSKFAKTKHKHIDLYDTIRKFHLKQVDNEETEMNSRVTSSLSSYAISVLIPGTVELRSAVIVVDEPAAVLASFVLDSSFFSSSIHAQPRIRL